jgi:ubiquitin carboxyl-terminal hydrolase 25/28
MKTLKEKISEIEHKISSIYNDQNMKTRRYSLYGVWLHQGVAGSGHYWSYIKNAETETKWIKFDDVRISEVEEQTVLNEAVGGGARSHTSAYFLIYVENKDGKRYQRISYDLKFSLEKIPAEIEV